MGLETDHLQCWLSLISTADFEVTIRSDQLQALLLAGVIILGIAGLGLFLACRMALSGLRLGDDDWGERLRLNVTERKRAEQALQEREAMLRAIGDNLPKGFIYQLVYDPNKGFYYSYISAGIERLLGIKPEAVLENAQAIRDIGLNDDLALADQLVQESLNNLSVIELQMRNRTASGEIRWSSIRSVPRRLADGRTVWDGVEVDITDLKRIEAALRASEEQFRKAFDDAPIGVSLVSPTGQFLKVNTCCCDLLGYTEAELLALNFQDITHPADLKADLEGFRADDQRVRRARFKWKSAISPNKAPLFRC